MVAQVSPLDDCAARGADVDAASVTAAMPAADTIEDLGEMFGLLSDPGRLRLLSALVATAELCVCDLAAVTGMRESAVSHALRLLRARRVVAVRRSGRRAYYRLDDAHVRELLATGLQHAGELDTRSSPDAVRAGVR